MPGSKRSALAGDLPRSRYTRGLKNPDSFHVFRYEDNMATPLVRSRPHRHDFFQLLWLEKGRGTLLCDLEEYAFEDQSLAFFSPGRLHAWNHEIEPRGTLIGFPQSFFHSDEEQPGILGRLSFLHEPVNPIIRFDEKTSGEMTEHFDQLLKESSSTLEERDDIVRALITIILSKTRRQFATVSRPAPAPEAYSSTLSRRFRLALDQHFPRVLRVSDYARLLSVSRSYLNEELRTHTGRTGSEHIHERILLEAKRLLGHSPYAIADIAKELNFRDPSYFSRFFRLHTRMSPGSYRKDQHGKRTFT
jgi:AraC family transcriptional regulator, transcriptional activator of pobA